MTKLPETMRAVEISGYGGPDVLHTVSRPCPSPASHEVVIRLAYAGINRPDVSQRMGAYAPPPGASDLPGLEGAGHIAAIGSDVTGWRVGDAVCALLPGGGYAEYAACPAAHVLPVPEGMTLREAGSLPETAFTVWSTVMMRGGLRAGERFLVHGGSSGIGTMAIQIAKAEGAEVWATAGTPKKCAACAALGAAAINYREQDFAAIMRDAGGANLILDMVGGDYIQRNFKSLADDGRLVQIAFLGGSKAEVNFNDLVHRRLTFTGATLRPQSNAAKARIADGLRAGLWPHIAAGKVRILIDAEYPLEQAADAHRHMERGDHIGKIVLKI